MNCACFLLKPPAGVAARLAYGQQQTNVQQIVL